MAAAPTLELLPLLAACAAAAERAGAIIRAVHDTRDLQFSSKRPDAKPTDMEDMDPADALTVADGRAQDAIVSSLQRRYPTLRIVGEEGVVPVGPDAFDITEEIVHTRVQALPPSPALERAAGLRVPLGAACLWVDPLDGTKEFVCGRVQSCTVLIGIAVDGTPLAGVVAEPFREAEGGELGVIHIGVVGCGLLLSHGPLCPRPAANFVVSTGRTKRPAVDQVLEPLKAAFPEVAVPLFGGCGNNVLRLVEGTTDALVSGPGCNRWDTCAVEALLHCVGGLLTDYGGSPYRYEPDGEMANRRGILAARDAAVHQRLLPFCHGVL